jgi:hypothetical protein
VSTQEHEKTEQLDGKAMREKQKQARKKAEAAIYAIIQEFQQESGLRVVNVAMYGEYALDAMGEPVETGFGSVKIEAVQP